MALLHWLHCFAFPAGQDLTVPDLRDIRCTKPLQIVVQMFPKLRLENLLLIDNRVENGHFNDGQFILLPDFIPTIENDFGACDHYLRDNLPFIVKKMQSIEFYLERLSKANLYYKQKVLYPNSITVFRTIRQQIDEQQAQKRSQDIVAQQQLKSFRPTLDDMIDATIEIDDIDLEQLKTVSNLLPSSV